MENNKNKQTDIKEEGNLNVMVDRILHLKAKARAGFLGLKMNEYIEKLIKEDTKNIKLE